MGRDQNSVKGTKSVCLVVTAEVTAVTFYKGYVRFLRDHGWAVSVIARSEGRLEEWAAQEGAIAYSVDLAREPSLLRDVKALMQIVRILRRIRPDAVVSATPKAGLIGTIASRLAGVPVRVYQIWGLRLETERGMRRLLLETTERLAISSSTRCLANSESLARVVRAAGLSHARAITVLGSGSSHGVDTEYFSRDLSPTADAATLRFLATVPADVTVAFIGRLSRDKGIDTLLKSLDLCLARGLCVRALIVGPAESWDVRNIEGHACADGLHFVGGAEDVRPYLVAADILCLPTLREGFPNVVLEAASMQVPAIVSDATGAVDSVVPNITGLTFPVGDAEQLAERLSRLAEDRPSLVRMGKAAREHVRRYYEQRQVWDLYESDLAMQVAILNNRLPRAQ
jgi:glycosyltransferase involved in cell wall biosynthesis